MVCRKSIFGCFRPSKPSVEKMVTTGIENRCVFAELPCFNTTLQIQVISDRSIRLKSFGRFLCFLTNVSQANLVNALAIPPQRWLETCNLHEPCLSMNFASECRNGLRFKRNDFSRPTRSCRIMTSLPTCKHLAAL